MSETLIFCVGTICGVMAQVAVSGQLQILYQNRNMGQSSAWVKKEIALPRTRKQCRWEWSAEGNALAVERMESLANLSGYQKPSTLGSFRPLDSITRQKWQLSNGNQPGSSRQTGMHCNSADLFHLQSPSTWAGGPPGCSWYQVFCPCRAEGLLKWVGESTEQERETAGVTTADLAPVLLQGHTLFAAKWCSSLTDLPSSAPSSPPHGCINEVTGK